MCFGAWGNYFRMLRSMESVDVGRYFWLDLPDSSCRTRSVNVTKSIILVEIPTKKKFVTGTTIFFATKSLNQNKFWAKILGLFPRKEWGPKYALYNHYASYEVSAWAGATGFIPPQTALQTSKKATFHSSACRLVVNVPTDFNPLKSISKPKL